MPHHYNKPYKRTKKNFGRKETPIEKRSTRVAKKLGFNVALSQTQRKVDIRQKQVGRLGLALDAIGVPKKFTSTLFNNPKAREKLKTFIAKKKKGEGEVRSRIPRDTKKIVKSVVPETKKPDPSSLFSPTSLLKRAGHLGVIFSFLRGKPAH